jgi:hypothetical protein
MGIVPRPAFWSPPDRNGATFGAEYQDFVGCQAWNCTIGIDVSAGNNQVTGGDFTSNANGVYVGQGWGHGIVVGATINHNDIGMYGSFSGAGEEFSDCAIYANGVAALFDNCGNISIHDCKISQGNVLFTNLPTWGANAPEGMNRFEGNIYTGTWGGTNSYDFSLLCGQTNQTPVVYAGNHSYTTNNTDGTYFLDANTPNSLIPRLPGITTNVSISGATLHITNGLIMQVSPP